eukprot:2672882-Prymnesium_polylepis.1
MRPRLTFSTRHDPKQPPAHREVPQSHFRTSGCTAHLLCTRDARPIALAHLARPNDCRTGARESIM